MTTEPEQQVVYAWGTITQVRDYLDFKGISVQIDRQEGMPFTFPSDILRATIDDDAAYQPAKGDRVKVTIGNGILVERDA